MAALPSFDCAADRSIGDLRPKYRWYGLLRFACRAGAGIDLGCHQPLARAGGHPGGFLPSLFCSDQQLNLHELARAADLYNADLAAIPLWNLDFRHAGDRSGTISRPGAYRAQAPLENTQRLRASIRRNGRARQT